METVDDALLNETILKINKLENPEANDKQKGGAKARVIAGGLLQRQKCYPTFYYYCNY